VGGKLVSVTTDVRGRKKPSLMDVALYSQFHTAAVRRESRGPASESRVTSRDVLYDMTSRLL